MTEALARLRPGIPGVATGTAAAAVWLIPGPWPKVAAAALLAGAALGWYLLARPGRWIPVFLCAAALLPPLPLPLGDSGPHPAMAVAGLGLASGLLWSRFWRLPASPLHYSLLAYMTTLAASLGWAAAYSGLAIAAVSAARVALFGISVYVFFDLTVGPSRYLGDRAVHRRLRLLFGIAVAAALFACLDFYYQFPAPAGFSEQYVWLDSGVYRRAQGFFYEASTLGNFCVFFLVMSAAALARRPPGLRIPFPALSAGAALFGVTLMLSYSRASVVAFLVAMSALLLLERRRLAIFRVLLLVPAAALLAGLFGLYAFPELLEAYRFRLAASAEHLLTATGSTLSGRLESWSALAEFLAAHPWRLFFGVGYKTLPYSELIGRPLIVDNAYLSALAETGAVGLAALLSLCFFILGRGWRAAQSPDRLTAFLGAWIFCFWTGQMVQMLSGDLFTYWRVLPLYFFVLALAARRSAVR